jgi:hypothetical protein
MKLCRLCYRLKFALAGTATQRSWRQRAMTTRLSYVNPFPHCVFVTLMSGPSASPPQCKGERTKHVRLPLLLQLLCASAHDFACSASHLVVILLLLYILGGGGGGYYKVVESGYRCDATRSDGCTALFAAARMGYVSSGRVLLEHGGDERILCK